MIYRLYVYKQSESVPLQQDVNAFRQMLTTHDHGPWMGHVSAWGTAFDVSAVENEIVKKLGSKCKVYQEDCYKRPQINYLAVVTSYAMAKEVVPKVAEISSRFGLILYDDEAKRVIGDGEVDHALIDIRVRERAFNDRIKQEESPVWRVENIYSGKYGHKRISSFVVTISKELGYSFEYRTHRFWFCLMAHLNKNEHLEARDRCFIVEGEDYEIRYTLEGYRKHPDKIGYVDENGIHAELIRRMSCYESKKWAEKNCSDEELVNISESMVLPTLKKNYPNDADRYVYLVKRIRKGCSIWTE